ncbi:leptin receptor overlapping transcript-like 1 [Pecten maximus]|uniref:leptin receptor overlapping transcript-like 1 n=1 Tax=Pecten maximus TaxID=6579 RepID=UPI001458C4A4|nr:leptin receptor overlapping transcript-like 1 [Pecten maximus]
MSCFFFFMHINSFLITKTALISLAFAAAVGITFLVLGCALPQFNNWWPLFVLFFYILAPLPITLSKRCMNSFDTTSSACLEMAIFVTTGIVVSSMGLPVVFAHVSVIQWGACALVLAANTVVFLTILGYFYVFDSDDLDYSMW